MHKFHLNFENIAKGIVHKSHKDVSRVNCAKPGFEWLKNYLTPNQLSSSKDVEREKPNMLRKNTTRRLLKSRQRSAAPSNENINILNNPSYGIMSKKAIVKKME